MFLQIHNHNTVIIPSIKHHLEHFILHSDTKRPHPFNAHIYNNKNSCHNVSMSKIFVCVCRLEHLFTNYIQNGFNMLINISVRKYSWDTLPKIYNYESRITH